MQDREFGEVLADIRDRLDVPLTLRVRQARVFMSAVILTLGTMAMALRGQRKLPSAFAIGLPNFEEDTEFVFAQFKTLDGLRCNAIQAEQAKELFQDVMERMQHRHMYEKVRWLSAMQAGIFLSSLTMVLLIASAVINLLTAHTGANAALLTIFIAVQVIASIISYKVFWS